MENDIIGMKSNNNLELPCFLLGLGAGVGLTLLFAPRSGDATRRMIGRHVSRHMKNGGDWVKDQSAAARDAVRDRVKEVAEVIGGN